MDPRYHRTPSPGQPLQHGYQLEDNPFNGQYAANQPSQQHLDDPYARQQHLDAPLPRLAASAHQVTTFNLTQQ